MIQIPRSLIHQVRAVFRRLVRRSSGATGQPVVFEAGPDGLCIRLHNYEACAEFHHSDPLAEGSFVVALENLADFEGKKKDLVSLESCGLGSLEVRWQDGVVPQVRHFQQLDSVKPPAFPTRAKEMTPNEPRLLQALVDAAQTAATDPTKFQLDHIQLRGSTGQIVATDSQQLFVQSGFQFGWSDDVLIPAYALAALRDLPHTPTVSIGKTATHVTLTSGDWTLHLPINAKGSFPDTDRVIPALSGLTSRAHLDAVDSEFLAQAIPNLPGKKLDHWPITLDLNGQVLARTPAAEDGQATELHLARSEASGPAVRVAMNRRWLAHALALGFTEVCVGNPEKPFIFQDEQRMFVVMPLENAKFDASEPVHRISSAGISAPVAPTARPPEPSVLAAPAVPVARATEVTVPAAPLVHQPEPISTKFGPAHANGVKPATNGSTKAVSRKTTAGTLAALISEAETLKDDLRQAFSRSHQLLMAIKKYRKQNKMVQSTLASLRQLKKVAG